MICKTWIPFGQLHLPGRIYVWDGQLRYMVLSSGFPAHRLGRVEGDMVSSAQLAELVGEIPACVEPLSPQMQQTWGGSSIAW